MTAVTSELTWLGSLLGDLGVKLSSPPTLFCDSQAAIHIAKNPVFHERTKHIEVDCHFVREKVQSKELKLEHVPASGQVADVLTKALPRKLYYKFLSKLGAYDLYAPACRGVDGDILGRDMMIMNMAMSMRYYEDTNFKCQPFFTPLF
ncbi:hypothetical protein KSP39_PZI008432 [Platanthera zijinensis]|uniref:Uncharacterized protein n=1 Tax=Platanthera zijinensis TaxID=2320716 RepID=A0AAP0G8L9_9ASPA